MEQAWYHLGVTYAKERQMDKALWAIDYALLIDDQFTAAYYEKARILERMERFEEAASTYRESFENDEPTGYGYYKMANCYRQMGDMRKALVFFSKAVSEDPELDEAHLELALVLDELDQIESTLMQPKSKAVQDALAFPIQLNDKLAGVAQVVSSADTKPTKASYTVYEDLAKKADVALGKLKELINQKVPAFNQMVTEQRIPAINAQ
jgi:tetratricopeptide (TPR) repeat protein